jgi:hypothetical protein
MEHRVHAFHRLLYRAIVPDVPANPRTVQIPYVGVESKVEERHRVARCLESFGQMAADESRPARNQNPAHGPTPAAQRGRSQVGAGLEGVRQIGRIPGIKSLRSH